MPHPDPSDAALLAWLKICPPWCAGEQCQADHREDRAHQSALSTVPVITYDRAASLVADRDIVSTTEFDLALLQRRPHGDIWIFIGDDHQAIELNLESAHRLHRELGTLLVTAYP